ncbi:MAG: preprotein translocase subunit YajC [Acidobacteria bacterium]|jgi:preprotein translocase subunit YajC|nr:MAG: preprotein translocase subunit YajC [Acidobacteriota bacterium]
MIDMAFAQQHGQGSSPAGALLFQLLFFAALFALFYFLLIRPQQKARRKHQEFLKGLKKGDRVITTGGVWGTVVEIGDDTVTLKVDANTRITFSKEYISHYQPDFKREEKEG